MDHARGRLIPEGVSREHHFALSALLPAVRTWDRMTNLVDAFQSHDESFPKTRACEVEYDDDVKDVM